MAPTVTVAQAHRVVFSRWFAEGSDLVCLGEALLLLAAPTYGDVTDVVFGFVTNDKSFPGRLRKITFVDAFRPEGTVI